MRVEGELKFGLRTKVTRMLSSSLHLRLCRHLVPGSPSASTNLPSVSDFVSTHPCCHVQSVCIHPTLVALLLALTALPACRMEATSLKASFEERFQHFTQTAFPKIKVDAATSFSLCLCFFDGALQTSMDGHTIIFIPSSAHVH